MTTNVDFAATEHMWAWREYPWPTMIAKWMIAPGTDTIDVGYHADEAMYYDETGTLTGWYRSELPLNWFFCHAG